MSLAEVLEMRDRRATLQRELLAAGGSLISFTLNIPGPVKRFPAADRAFDQAASLLRERLAALQQSMGGEQQRFSVEGTADFRFLAGRGAACAADGGKQSCLIEESQISGEDGVYTMTLRLTAGGNDAAALR